MRIVYAGTPEFAVPALIRLQQDNLTPVAVLTQPDRPAGRGRKLRPSAVKKAALELGLPIHQPDSLRNPEQLEWLTALQPDLVIVTAYGLILPSEILEVPSHGCWNIHASLLPRWRGAAPIQRAIEAGDRVSGVTIMQMNEGLDTGPILHQEELTLDEKETAATLHNRLAQLGADALMTPLRRLRAGEIPEPTPQDEERASHAAKLSKSEAEIDWRQPAERIERCIRAFNPWPVAWCLIGDERVRIWDADWSDARHGEPPGSVVRADAAGIIVAAGTGLVRINELQRPGGRRQSAADFLNARQLPDSLRASP